MKKLCHLKLAFAVYGIASMFCLSCVSLVEKAGQAVDGSAFSEKKTAVYKASIKDGDEVDMEVWEIQNKAGERSLVVTLGQYPAIKIRGTAADNMGEFNLTTMDYLGGNSHGWNEYRIDLYGHGNISLGESTAVISLSDEIETVQISWGRIRRYDTRITGAEALTNLRNRRERILALCEWMHSLPGSPEGINKKEFENYWKPVLFPEVVSRTKRPNGWELEGDIRIKAEDIRWNTGYTERVFPELLQTIRNSGTMLRDWEEATDWIYLEYEWDKIISQLTRETVLNRKK